MEPTNPLRSRLALGLFALFLLVGATGCLNASAFASFPRARRVRAETIGCTLGGAGAPSFAQAIAAVDQRNGWDRLTCLDTLLDLERMTQAAPDDLVGRYYAGAVLMRCGEPVVAEAMFQSIVDREPTFHRARVWAAVLKLQRTRDVDDAIEQLSRADRDSNGENTEALVHLAHLELTQNGSAALARAHLERAIMLGEDSESTYVDLTRAYLEASNSGRDRGSLELAEKTVEAALELHPESASLHDMAGVVAVSRGDSPRAAQELDRARALDPKQFEAAMNRAALDVDLQDFRGGEQDYRTALRIRPDDYDARIGLALALLGQGSSEKEEAALEHLGVARAIDPRRPEAPTLLGELGARVP